MSQQPSAPLLWINKDASNVHRKKHVAEVNAHVQKSSLKKRAPKRPITQKKTILPARKVTVDEPSQRSPGLSSNSSSTENDTVVHEIRHSTDHEDFSETALVLPASSAKDMPPALIFSSYLEDGVLHATDTTLDEDEDLNTAYQLARLPSRIKSFPSSSLDASNPLPTFLEELSSHDKMLVHIHLTYMPQMFYGLSGQAAYCPIRNASVTNMLRAPIGLLWVLISVEMFLETVRKSNARKAVILRRKNQAYQLMSESFKDPSRSTEETLLLGSKSAAIAEMFCGDPAKALTHLNGIDAFIRARGGLEYIKKMDLTISMPVFAVSAYRTILQDNLNSRDSFERARTKFISTTRSLITWNCDLPNHRKFAHHPARHGSPQDEGFDGNYDLVEGLADLREARDRAFLQSPLLQKFTAPGFETDKLGERIDHFIILYNLNRALADHGTSLKQAAIFIDDLLEDVEASGSTRGVDSSIKLSGVLRLITNRQCKMHPGQPSMGVAHAWEVLDALEIMKLLTPDMQRLVHQTLHLLLLGQNTGILTEQDFIVMESAMNREWLLRHPRLSLSPG